MPKREPSTDGSPRRKQSFGGTNIDHISPPPDENVPKAMNIVLSFEDALKLHLSLGQLLGHLNGYDRATKKGRRTGVNLCVYPAGLRITVTERQIKE